MDFASKKRIVRRPTLHMFRSERVDGLNAFTVAESGVTLPEKFAPWARTGSLEHDVEPPHGLDRTAIQDGISRTGYQLWRRKAKAASETPGDA